MDQQFAAKMHALLQEVYEAGRRDGGAAMRDAILKAAEVPVLPAPAPAPAPKPRAVSVDEATPRAPRGIMPQVLRQAMEGKDGMTEQQIIDTVATIDARVSPRSVGGQLRRFRGTYYRQEGRKWFLLDGKAAGQASADPADLL